MSLEKLQSNLNEIQSTANFLYKGNLDRVFRLNRNTPPQIHILSEQDYNEFILQAAKGNQQVAEKVKGVFEVIGNTVYVPENILSTGIGRAVIAEELLHAATTDIIVQQEKGIIRIRVGFHEYQEEYTEEKMLKILGSRETQRNGILVSPISIEDIGLTDKPPEGPLKKQEGIEFLNEVFTRVLAAYSAYRNEPEFRGALDENLRNYIDFNRQEIRKAGVRGNINFEGLFTILARGDMARFVPFYNFAMVAFDKLSEGGRI